MPAKTREIEETFHKVLIPDTTSQPLKLTEKAWDALGFAYQYVKKEFTTEKKYEPMSFRQVVPHLNQSTSAGFSFPGKKKGQVIEEAIKKAEDLAVQVRSGQPIVMPPCKLASRGKLRRLDDPKAPRLIYNYPVEQLILEASYAIPLIEFMRDKKNSIMLFGSNIIPRIYDTISKRYPRSYWTLRTDISKFDTSVHAFMIKIAFQIIEANIDFDHWDGVPLTQAQKKRWGRVWDYVKYYFTYTPIMSPSGIIKQKKGKIPSGGEFTQLVGSIVNALYLVMVAHYHDHTIKELRVLGDDGFPTVFQKPNVDSWAACLLQWFNVKMSVEKTMLYRGDDPNKTFLGYYFKGGFLYRHTDELFMSALYPEREVDTLEKSFSRLIAYMYLGGVNDIEFTKFFIRYQTGYPIDYEQQMELDYPLQVKVGILGFPIPIKKFKQYTMSEFLHRLTNPT